MSDIETASAVEKLQLELQEGEKPTMVHLFSLVENTHANCLRASEEGEGEMELSLASLVGWE